MIVEIIKSIFKIYILKLIETIRANPTNYNMPLILRDAIVVENLKIMKQ